MMVHRIATLGLTLGLALGTVRAQSADESTRDGARAAANASLAIVRRTLPYVHVANAATPPAVKTVAETAAPTKAPSAKPTTERAAAKKPPMFVVIERETFSYGGAARRDPFKSLFTTSELRPTLAELRLVAVAFDPAGSSVAILRDLNTKQRHRVRVGSLLGRMRVAGIRPKAVVFNIEELGYSRQETLGLNDSTAVRSR